MVCCCPQRMGPLDRGCRRGGYAPAAFATTYFTEILEHEHGAQLLVSLLDYAGCRHVWWPFDATLCVKWDCYITFYASQGHASP